MRVSPVPFIIIILTGRDRESLRVKEGLTTEMALDRRVKLGARSRGHRLGESPLGMKRRSGQEMESGGSSGILKYPRKGGIRAVTVIRMKLLIGQR